MNPAPTAEQTESMTDARLDRLASLAELPCTCRDADCGNYTSALTAVEAQELVAEAKRARAEVRGLTAVLDAARALAEGVGACPPPNIASGYDLCPCGTGPAWPCPKTRLAWLAAGIDAEVEIKRVCDAAAFDAWLANGPYPEEYDEAGQEV